MKTMTFQRPHDLSGLHDELLEAGAVAPGALVRGDGENLTLRLPDEADEAAVRAVVDAHDAELALARREKLAEIDAEMEARKFASLKAEAERKKAQVRALQNKAAVRAFDARAGWPGGE